MIGFIQHLVEKKTLAKSSELLSDDKGKLHELLLAKHLNPKGVLPSHWRSKSEDYGGTPHQVHARLKAKVGSAAYAEINTHAKNTAAAVVNYMKEAGHLPKGSNIHDVHWTSNRDAEHNPGDHEKTTGVKDRNSNADIIVTVKHKNGEHKFLGISAKYGGQSKPNLKNSGLNTLEKDAGVEKGTYTKILNKHNSDMEKLGYTGTRKQRHTQYKSDIKERAENPNSNTAQRATAAEQSSLKSRTEMAAHHRTALSKKSDPELRELVRNIVSPKTIHPHIVAHSHVQSDGTAIPRIHKSSSHADDHLAKFDNLHVDKSEKGISVNIKGIANSGKHKGKKMVVATQTFKAGSGPHNGAAGSFKL